MPTGSSHSHTTAVLGNSLLLPPSPVALWPQLPHPLPWLCGPSSSLHPVPWLHDPQLILHLLWLY